MIVSNADDRLDRARAELVRPHGCGGDTLAQRSTGHGKAARTARDAETILHQQNREISILVACDEVTVTHARYAAGEQVAGPHVHDGHTDAFYVLEGELTFEIGREGATTTVSAGGFVAVPPGVAHALRNDGDRPARWLTIHAHDGGFAKFMRGIRDGVEVDWDIAAVPADGGLPAREAIVKLGGGSRL